MHTILFIINPISGHGHKERAEAAIKTQLDASKFSTTIRYTEHAGHAAELASEAAAQGVDVVVAVGGDGTVNEVARSLVHTETALGIIPCGSGNGLARHLRIPLDPDEAVKLIGEMCIERLDYGLINGQPFFCTCGVGFDAFISMKFAEAGTRGLKTYVEKTLQDGLGYKPERYTIVVEDAVPIGGETADSAGATAESEAQATHSTEAHEAFLIACANASQYGNNAYIAPSASTRDGMLDVTILTPFTPIETPQIAFQLFNRKLQENSHVKAFRTRHLRIIRQSEGAVHRDGDPLEMGKEIDVRIVPADLKVVVNGHPGHRSTTLPIVEEMQRGIEDMQRGIEERQREFEDTVLKKFIEPFQKLMR